MPRLQWEKQEGVYVFTAAPPVAVPSSPAPATPQVNVTNALPKTDSLAASINVTGPGAIDTILELRLLSLQTERKALQVDFSGNSPQLNRNTAEIKAIRQMMLQRRAEKAMPEQNRKAAEVVRPKATRKTKAG